MQLSLLRLRPLLRLALILSSYQVADAATCKTLSDPTSTLILTIASWFQVDPSVLPVDTAFTDIDSAFPWFSKCAAAIDPEAVYVSLSGSKTLQTCLSTLENFDLDLSTADGWSSACPMIEDTVVPCIQTAMTESIMDAFDSTNTCCDDFLTKTNSLFGASLDEMVKKLLELATNVACSERTYTNLKGTVTKEMCGYSILNSFSFMTSEQDPLPDILSMVQVPNDQMCNAFSGKKFTTTKTSQVTLGFGTNGVDTMGICLQPVDQLIQHMGSWPMFSLTLDADGTDIKLSDLFAAGKSLRGNLLLDYATTSTNMPIMFMGVIDGLIAGMYDVDSGSAVLGSSSTDSGVVDGFLGMASYIDSYATALPLHIPNNGDCTFADQTIVEPFGTSDTATATGSSSAAKLSTVATGVAALVSSLLVLVVL